MAEISLEKKALASGAMKTCFKARVLEGDSEQLSPGTECVVNHQPRD